MNPCRLLSRKAGRLAALTTLVLIPLANSFSPCYAISVYITGTPTTPDTVTPVTVALGDRYTIHGDAFSSSGWTFNFMGLYSSPGDQYGLSGPWSYKGSVSQTSYDFSCANYASGYYYWKGQAAETNNTSSVFRTADSSSIGPYITN
jgi:hypothetical protein